MRLRLLSSPWWTRWAALSCLLAVVITLMAVLAAPQVIRALRWPWPVVLLAITAVALGGLWAVVTQPQHRLYLLALQGLNSTDRHRVFDAIRRGDVPEDPGVLGAAIRLSRLFVPRRSLAKRQLAFTVLAIAAWIALAVLGFTTGEHRQGVAWLVVAAIVGAATVWDRRRRQRIQRHIDTLRAAASQIPGGLESAGAESNALEASLRRATRIWAIGAVVILVGAISLTYFLARTSPDCHTGRDVIVYLNDHKNLVDANLITIDGPPLGEYQAWSDRLRQYADKVSDEGVARHVEHIAAVSAQAVAVVRDARTGPGGAAAPDQRQLKANYNVLMKSVADKAWAIADVCRLR